MTVSPRGCLGIGLPVSPGRAVGTSETLGDKVATGEVDKCFARGGQGFVVFAEPTIVSQPSKRALYHPASCLQTKAFFSTTSDNLKHDAETQKDTVGKADAFVASVEPQIMQSW